jgi:plastocyanin
VVVGPGNTLSFAPSTVDIAAGGTVTWNWAGGITMVHNVTSGDTVPAFAASPTQSSGSFQATFAKAGSFFYFCTVHGRTVMNGTVNVH